MDSRLCGGRPCSALDCETTNGSGSKIFCPGEKVMWAAMQQTIGCSFYAVLYRYRTGVPCVICPRVLAIGTSYTSALTDGRRAAFSIAFSVVGERRRQRIHDDRRLYRARSRAQCWRSKNGPQAIGRSRGGLTTKIYALVDALGNPVELMFTPGQDHDLTCAEPLIENADPEALIGDKAYDADPFVVLSPSVELVRSFRPRPTETSSGSATSHSIVNAIWSSASSICSSTSAPSPHVTTSLREISSPGCNWLPLQSSSTEYRP